MAVAVVLRMLRLRLLRLRWWWRRQGDAIGMRGKFAALPSADGALPWRVCAAGRRGHAEGLRWRGAGIEALPLTHLTIVIVEHIGAILNHRSTLAVRGGGRW